MAAAPHKVFDELPVSLRKALGAADSFTEIQHIFRIFLARLEEDLNRAAENPFKASRAFVVMEYLRAEFENFGKKVKTIQHIQSTQVLPKIFEEAEIPEMPLNEGFKVEVTPKLFCSITKMAKPAAHEWLREHGLGDIIQPEVNVKTLTSAIHEYMQENGEEPPQKLIST